MSHLLALAVGPVQEFIAAARRTRDLWLGSFLLSEIGKAVARSVREQGGQLVFPHPETDLTPDREEVNVANVIVAELPTGDPRAVADLARQAAQQRWLEFADQAWKAAEGIIRQEIWEDQANDVLEFYSAWVPQTGDYQSDRGKLMRLLTGRKNCRDFLPAKGRAGVPKSSLDGQRESVLKDPKKERWPKSMHAKTRIRQGEQLDVVGVVKRLAGGERTYPSVSRVAADPWIRGNHQKAAFQDLKAACDRLPRHILHRVRGTAMEAFPYEGTAVYLNRHREWTEELGEEECPDLSDIQNALSRLPMPLPYLAVLVADGDKMGAALSKLPHVDANRAFSRALSGFADQARHIVTRYHGVLVYAGGDDVLAFLPVDTCLNCARDLREQFVVCLQSCLADIFRENPSAQPETPTLSVGIAIGHFLENLEDLLDYGRHAEKAAKKVRVKRDDKTFEKDALAVQLYKRSGSPIAIASRWETNPDRRLTLYAELIQTEALSSKLPYDLRKLVDLYRVPGWPKEERKAAMQKDALRIIADKQPRAGRKYLKHIRGIVEAFETVQELERFCEELLIARLLAEVFQQAQRVPTQLRLLEPEAAA